MIPIDCKSAKLYACAGVRLPTRHLILILPPMHWHCTCLANASPAKAFIPTGPRNARSSTLVAVRLHFLDRVKGYARSAELSSSHGGHSVWPTWPREPPVPTRQRVSEASLSVFKIEALIWLSFRRAFKFQPLRWKACSNPRRPSTITEMKYKDASVSYLGCEESESNPP